MMRITAPLTLPLPVPLTAELELYRAGHARAKPRVTGQHGIHEQLYEQARPASHRCGSAWRRTRARCAAEAVGCTRRRSC